MMLKRFVIAALFSLLSLSSSFAQTPPPSLDKTWSRAELIERTLQRHPVVRAADANIDIFEAKLQHARRWWVPTAKFRALFGVIPGANGNAVAGATDFGSWGAFGQVEASMVVPICTFGKVSALKEMAKSGVDIAQSQREMARNVALQQINEAYSSLVLARQYIKELKKAQGYLKSAQKSVNKMEEEDSDDYDPTFQLQLRIVQMETKTRTLEAQDAAELAKEAIIALAGLSPNDKVQLQEKTLKIAKDKEVPDLAECLDTAMRERPEQKALRAAQRVRHAAVDNAKSELYPVLALGAFVRFAKAPTVEDQGSPFAYDPYNIFTGGGGLILQWNVDLPRRASMVQQARAEVRKVMAQSDAFTAMLRLDVQKAYRGLASSRARVQHARAATKAARGWLTAKLDLFDSGLVDFSSVSSAMKAYYEWRFKYLKAMYQARAAQTNLWLTIGSQEKAQTGSKD